MSKSERYLVKKSETDFYIDVDGLSNKFCICWLTFGDFGLSNNTRIC
jgi:hypothetical protein